MEIFKTVQAYCGWRSSLVESLGFVPTMGALHEGHLSLVKKSKKICNKTVVSIFINPTQFAQHEDLNSYPQTLKKDVQCLEKLSVDVLFLPTEKEMYKTVDDVNVLETVMFTKLEGASRPHFFKGVTTIVSKLFNVMQPSHAFFGEKDAQQWRIIKQMIDNMNYNINLICCPTIRDKNGLALSSRNQYLSNDELLEASHFHRCLMGVKYLLDQGELDSVKLKKQFERDLFSCSKFTIDYISISCSNTLNEFDNIVGGALLISAAVFFNKVRLIDNFSYQSST